MERGMVKPFGAILMVTALSFRGAFAIISGLTRNCGGTELGDGHKL